MPRHWIEPLQVLETMATGEGIRSFTQDAVECGFSRAEAAELFGTFYEDRLAETLALAIAAGAYPDDDEFNRRLSDVLQAPHLLFAKDAEGPKALPVDENYQACLREAAIAIEASFHRFVEGDYPPVLPTSTRLREAYTAMLDGNLARSFDRLTAAGACALEGAYLAKPTEWLETEPLYSWMLGAERIAFVVRRLEGWPGGRFEDWAHEVPLKINWRREGDPPSEMTRARQSVLELLSSDEFNTPELTRMRRNKKWIGPECLRLLRMPDEDTTPTVIRNAVRTIGAVEFRPAIDDILGMLMRLELERDELDRVAADELLPACEEALAGFGASIKEELLHHFDLALVDEQKYAIARVLSRIPDDDDVMEILEHLTAEAQELHNRFQLYELVAAYPHNDAKSFLRKELERLEENGHPQALKNHLASLLSRSRRRSRSAKVDA